MKVRLVRVKITAACVASFLFASTHCFALSGAEILTLIRNNSQTPPDELYGKMPEELRSNFALMKKSRNNSQHASPEAPRIINYSSDGRVFMASSGNSKLPGGETFEFFFQDARGNFRPMTATFKTGEGWKIDRNPKSCTGCHGVPPRPIWDGYPFWPDSYGSNHDRLKKTKAGAPDSRADIEFRKTSSELKELNAFLDGPAKEGRYAQIPGISRMSYSDFANGNSHLSTVVESTYSRQWAAALLDHPEFHRYQGIFFETFQKPLPLFDYEDFGKWPEGKPGALRREYEKIGDRRRREIDLYFSNLTKRFGGDEFVLPTLEARKRLADTQIYILSGLELMARKMGISESLWSTGIQGVPGYQGGIGSQPENLWTETVRQLVHRDPEMAAHVKFPEYVLGRDLGLPENLKPQLSAEGLKRIQRPGYRIPKGPLYFEPVPRIYPRHIEDITQGVARATGAVGPVPEARLPVQSCVTRVKNALRGFVLGR